MQMDNQHLERHSYSLVTMEVKIVIDMLTPHIFNVQLTVELQITSATEGVEQEEISYMSGEIAKWSTTFKSSKAVVYQVTETPETQKFY